MVAAKVAAVKEDADSEVLTIEVLIKANLKIINLETTLKTEIALFRGVTAVEAAVEEF